VSGVPAQPSPVDGMGASLSRTDLTEYC
jgi:hypothetical protein